MFEKFTFANLYTLRIKLNLQCKEKNAKELDYAHTEVSIHVNLPYPPSIVFY